MTDENVSSEDLQSHVGRDFVSVDCNLGPVNG